MKAITGFPPAASRSESIRLAVVVVHYAPEELAHACLRSVLAADGSDGMCLVFVDNSATATPALRRRVQDAHGLYLHYPENLGFAAAVNVALVHARQRFPDAIVVLNSDVLATSQALRRLSEALRDPTIGIAGPALLSASSKRRYWNVGSVIRWPRCRPQSLRHDAPYDRNLRSVEDVGFVCGAAFALRSMVLEQVGFLSEAFFLYFEDAEFSYRVRREGLRTVVVPEARMFHHGGAGVRGADRGVATYYRTRNRLLFSRMWQPDRFTGRVCRGASVLWLFVRALRRGLCGQAAEAWSLSRAARDHLLGRYGKRGRTHLLSSPIANSGRFTEASVYRTADRAPRAPKHALDHSSSLPRTTAAR